MPHSPIPVSSIYKLIPSGRVKVCLDPMEIGGLSGSLDLPGRPVTGLGQDARGYLWLGTENGVLLFDGLHCAAPPALAGLQGSIVFEFCFIDDHSLWIGTHGTGLARVRLGMTGPRVEGNLTEAEGLPSNYVHCMSMDRHRRLWVGTPEGIAVIDRGAVVRSLGGVAGLPSTKVQALYCDAHGRVWVGTDKGLRVLTDDAVDQHFVPGPCASEPVARIYGDPHGRIWVGMRDGALFRVVVAEEGPARFAAVRAGGAAVLTMCCDRQGRLWVGTDQGVQVYDDDVLCDSLTITDGLPSAIVRVLLRDGDDRIWAGTQKGLAVLTGPDSPARPLGGSAAPERRQAWNFAPDDDGRMWLATDTGLSLVDSWSERTIPCPDLPEPLGETTVWSLSLDHDRQLWAGTRRHGLFCLDATTGALRAHLLADQTVGVVALCLVGERQLWAASPRHGVLCVDTRTKSILRQVDAAAGLHDAGALALGLDQRGRLWAGTISGRLVCIDTQHGVVLQTIDLSEAAGPHLIQYLGCDQDGMVWVCTNGGGLLGVDVARATVARAATVADGLPSNLLYSCRLDEKGNLWLGTGRGVTHFVPTTGQVTTIDQSLGLPHEECDFGALCFDNRGQLWVGTVSGVAIIDPARLPDSATTCPVYLTALRVMGEERDLDADLELEDSAYDVQFEYAAVSFTAPHAVRYRVQLLGLEADWSPPTRERSRRYTNLRPGKYKFCVSARNWGGTWSPPMEVPFRVIRNRRAQEAEETLERERITKEVYRATAARLEDLNAQLVVAQAAADKTRAQAEALAELRSSFVAAVSHELRNPLAAIVGYAEFLQGYWDRLDNAARRERIDRIVAAANRQRVMVEELLLLSRLEMGALETRVESILLAGIVEAATDEVRASYRDQRIDTEGPADLQVWADPDRTMQILVNLVDNAAKYSPEGARIHVLWHAHGSHAVVLVRDAGTGIAAEGRELLFTRFGRVPGSRTRAGRVGTGLGLYLGRALARGMHGELDLAATGPDGSVFRLTLPR